MGVVALRLENIVLSAGAAGGPLLEAAGLTLPGGKVWGVAGPNLSGRSALLRYAGSGHLYLDPETSRASATLEGGPGGVVPFDPARHAAFLGPNPQDGLSTLTDSVAEEVELHRALGEGSGWGGRETEADALVARFGLDALLTREPLGLSGGQTAALALVCALLMRRPVLCVDDAMAQLDPPRRVVAWDVLAEYAHAGPVVLVAENHYDLMARHAAGILILRDGRVEPGSPVPPAAFRPELVAPADRDPSPGAATPTRPGLPLEFADLKYQYPGHAGHWALDGATARLPAATSVGLVGPNGAGKTTLCRVLNGILRPGRGVVRLGGEEVDPYRHPGRYIAYAFQNPDDQIFRGTVSAEVGFGPRLQGKRGAALDQLVRAALEEFGLGGLADRHPLDLPAVLRRRVTHASAVAMNCPWTVFDEPTLGQDAGYGRRLAAVIGRMKAAGAGVIVISHDTDFVGRVCDRQLVLAAGRCTWADPGLPPAPTDDFAHTHGGRP